MKKHKSSTMPAKFRAGFIEDLDHRTEIARALRRNYNDYVHDLGGKEQVSHAKRVLIERFVFLTAVLQHTEAQIAKNPKAEELSILLGRYTQGLNSLLGLGKSLGLEISKSAKGVTLKGYLKSKRDDDDDD